MARRAVHAVVAAAAAAGVDYVRASVKTPALGRKLDHLGTTQGECFSAGQYIFACDPWLGKVFPGLLGDRIFPTRQEVFFFGVPAGDPRFEPGTKPAWIYLTDEVYGLPDLESRGFKISLTLLAGPLRLLRIAMNLQAKTKALRASEENVHIGSTTATCGPTLRETFMRT